MSHKKTWGNPGRGYPCLEEICEECRTEWPCVTGLEEENERLKAELRNIRDAKPSEWGEDMADQFRPWAQNRARAALGEDA